MVCHFHDKIEHFCIVVATTTAIKDKIFCSLTTVQMETMICHFHGKTEHFSIVVVATPTAMKGKGLLRFYGNSGYAIAPQCNHIYIHCISNK